MVKSPVISLTIRAIVENEVERFEVTPSEAHYADTIYVYFTVRNLSGTTQTRRVIINQMWNGAETDIYDRTFENIEPRQAIDGTAITYKYNDSGDDTIVMNVYYYNETTGQWINIPEDTRTATVTLLP